MATSCEACSTGNICYLHSYYSSTQTAISYYGQAPPNLQLGTSDVFASTGSHSFGATSAHYTHGVLQPLYPYTSQYTQPNFPPNAHPPLVSYSAPAATVPSTAPPHVLDPTPTTATTSRPKRKRTKKSGQGGPASKQPRTQVIDAGVGPSSQRSRSPPHTNLDTADQAAASIPASYRIPNPTQHADCDAKTTSTGGADCWALLIGTNYKDRPTTEDVAIAKSAASAHLKVLPGTLRRPSDREFKRLLCIPCLTTNDTWHTWANTNGGSTDGPRTHFTKSFAHKYLASCARIGYDRVNTSTVRSYEAINEDITKDGLARYIAELVAEQDLAFNVVQAPAFRRLLCYVGQNNLTAATIPERRAVRQAAADLTEQEKGRIAKKMQEAEGRISMTSDLWSDGMGRSFMAVTGHCETESGSNKGEDKLTVDLMAFRAVECSHNGVNLGTIFHGIMSEYGITHKVGSITLDNASNNDTMMEELQRLIRNDGYTFDKDGNRLRCVPHVINLSVGVLLDDLVISGEVYRQQMINDGHTPSRTTEGYLDALQSRLDKRVRQAVVALRHEQHRRGLKQTTKEGNEKGYWNYWEEKSVKKVGDDGVVSEVLEKSLVKVILKLLELVHDCKTRWSSTRNMIDRYLYLYPVISHYISQNKELLASHALSHTEFQVLQDILAVLNIAHEAQELLSAEQTPTLSLAFPVYESLISRWRSAARKYPALAYAINSAIDKISDYIETSRSSPIHVLAMFLNPSVKYSHIDEHWPQPLREHARKVVHEYMMRYAKEREHQAQAVSARLSTADLSTRASTSLGRGFGNILFRQGSLFESSSVSMIGVTPPRPTANRQSPVSAPLPQETPTRQSSLASAVNNGSPARITSRMQLETTVALEHSRYLALPGNIKDLGKVDLVKYWNLQITLPILRAISKDVLPAQASSVSSERVFSSSKRTCTQARNKISPQTVEMLQILKYSLRNRHSAHSTSSDSAHPDEVNSSKTLDMWSRVGDDDWTDDAILDIDPES